MKQFLKVAAMTACLLYLGACTKSPEQKAEAPKPVSQHKTWQVGSYVDEFGEPTGNKYVYAEATGHFSNSATNNSALAVVLQPFEGVNVYGDTLGNINIKLMEYGNRWVKGKGAMYISVKGNDGTIVKSQCYNDDRGETVIYSLKNDYEADSIFNLLLAGGKVMFSIETAKAPYSSYKFTITNADGLMEAIEAAK